ncbi:FtsX-like permease family protein [Gemmatimonadota bacterium]
MFKNYLTVAIRNLLRHKTYSAINIAGLAIGMACCIVILLLVRHELSFDSFHKNADRIYRLNIRVNVTGEAGDAGICAGAAAPVLAEKYPEVVNYARIEYNPINFLAYYRGERALIDETYFADQSLFDIFDFELIAGNRQTLLKEPFTAVITAEAAQKIFGDEDPLGKFIRQNGEREYKVTGVLEDIPDNSHIKFNMLLSNMERNNDPRSSIHQWESFNYLTYILLKENAEPKVFEAKLPEFVQQNFLSMANNIELHLQPLKELHLHSAHILYELNWHKSDIKYVYIYSCIAAIVLLIACINFMNLSTARSASRAKEVGIRKVAGARRAQLIKQFLGESVLVAFFALLLGIALVELTLPFLNAFFESTLSFNAFTDWSVLLVFIGIVLCVGLLAGSYPAFIISAFQPKETLKGFTGTGGKGAGFRKLMVVAQFAITIILVTCTGFISKQLHYIQNKDLGFNKEQVISVPIKHENVRLSFDTIRQNLLRNPAITGVTAASTCFSDKNIYVKFFRIEGDAPDAKRLCGFSYVDYDFFSFYGIDFVEGRAFSREFPTDTSGTGTYIINEAMADQLGWDTSVGKKLGNYGGNPDDMGIVIGVVKDFNFATLHEKIKPFALSSSRPKLRQVSIRIQPDNMQEALAFIESKWAEYDPEYPFEYTFQDEDFALLYRSEQRMGKIVGAFTLLAIFLACLGLLGLISFAAESRTREIGVRKVLGASVPQIVSLLSKELLVLLLIATLIAWPVAWYAMDKWLQNFAYRVELDVWTFILAGVLAMVIAAVTVGFQAVKAAYANPVEALRYE